MGGGVSLDSVRVFRMILTFSPRPAYIAGVTNPIFESSRAWDLLLDISTGHVVVAKDILATYPTTPGQVFNPPLITRSGTLKAEASLGADEEIMKAGGKGPADFVPKADNNADSLFMEDVSNVSSAPSARKFIFEFLYSSKRLSNITMEKAWFAYGSLNMSPGSLGWLRGMRRKRLGRRVLGTQVIRSLSRRLVELPDLGAGLSSTMTP